VSCAFKIVDSWWVVFIKKPIFTHIRVDHLAHWLYHMCPWFEVMSFSGSILITSVRAVDMRFCCKTGAHYSWDLLWPDIPQLSAACPVYTPVFCKCHTVSAIGQASLRKSIKEHGLPTSQSHQGRHTPLPPSKKKKNSRGLLRNNSVFIKIYCIYTKN